MTMHSQLASDGFAWLPKEKILFTGDAWVDSPYNCPQSDVLHHLL
jgi:hypothetical protein